MRKQQGNENYKREEKNLKKVRKRYKKVKSSSA